MSDKGIKQIRGQVRQVVKDLLPGLLTQELVENIAKKLTADLTLRLKNIENTVKTSLEAVDQRSKDTMSYLVNTVTAIQTQGANVQQPTGEERINGAQEDNKETKEDATETSSQSQAV